MIRKGCSFLAVLLLGTIAGFVFGYALCRFNAEDSCFDSGAAWNDEWGFCERVIVPAEE